MSNYIVTGAKGGSPPQGAAAPNRIEIHNFVKIEDQFSLYIQALREFLICHMMVFKLDEPV
jgi:tyrosinase